MVAVDWNTRGGQIATAFLYSRRDSLEGVAAIPDKTEKPANKKSKR